MPTKRTPVSKSHTATARWFAQAAHEMQADYDRLHKEAIQDPQYAGHGAENGWKSFLQRWLPSQYEIGTRKYVLPEVENHSEGDRDLFETDLVIFNPTYPERLREETEILAGGILAAFSVKLTVDASGLRDAVKRAAILKRSASTRLNTPRAHLQGAYAVGLLSHSHIWKAPSSTPLENVNRNLAALNREYAAIPREVIDLACIADLATWSTSRWIDLAGGMPKKNMTQDQIKNGAVSSSTGAISSNETEYPVARFIMQLIYRLSYSDPLLKQWALGLLAALPVAASSPDWRHWNVSDALSERIADEIRRRGFDNSSGPNDWSSVFG